MAILDDLLAELVKHTQYNSVLLAGMWQWIQKKEADKTPDDVNFYTVELTGNENAATLLVGRNTSRKEVQLVVGSSSGSIIISNRNFDPVTAQTQLAAANGTLDFAFLPSGTDVRIPTRGALYVAASQATKAATVMVAEPVFNTPPQHTANMPATHFGVAAMMERGLPFDADRSDLQRPMV